MKSLAILPSRPWSLPVPGPEFYVDPLIWDQMLWSVWNQKPVLITGPTGCGKSHIVSCVAAVLDRILYSVNMGGTTDCRLALVGTTHFTGSETRFTQSHFVTGLEDGSGLILLDELSRGSLDAFNLIISALDGQAYIRLDEDQPPRTVRRHPNVAVMATANFGEEYLGTRLDRALKDRFLILELDYPPERAEVQLLIKRTSISKTEAGKLVAFAQECRGLWRRDELSTPVSTRMLLAAGEMVSGGFSLLEALTPSVLNFFDASDSVCSERMKVRQLLQRL